MAVFHVSRCVNFCWFFEQSFYIINQSITPFKKSEYTQFSEEKDKSK